MAHARNVAMSLLGLLALCGLAAGCDDDGGATGDPDLGPIDDTVDFAGRINWPGIDRADGRQIPFIFGFANGRPHGYWFLSFASRRTADAFFFCREGDTTCPLDEHRRLDWSHLVGHPLFMRVPGQEGFSPFWALWRVTVPADFEPDSVKTIQTLHRLDAAGAVRVEPFILDFGEDVGPREALLHCALVLQGTELAEADTPMPDESAPKLRLERRLGWHQGYRVEFVDFSRSEGVFPSAEDSDSRPLQPFANIYIHWRSCAGDSPPPICSILGFPGLNRRPVSERGLGQDITGNNSPNDSNNVLGAVQCDRTRPSERLYSPLWQPQFVMVQPGADVGLIDTYADRSRSDIQSADDLFAAADRGEVGQPVPQREDETGNPVPGNDGRVFFNCPAPVPEGFVPYPCEAP